MADLYITPMRFLTEAECQADNFGHLHVDAPITDMPKRIVMYYEKPTIIPGIVTICENGVVAGWIYIPGGGVMAGDSVILTDLGPQLINA